MDGSGMETGKLDDTENERRSVLLSRLLEREFLLTQEAVDIKRRTLLMSEWLSNDEDRNMHEFKAGSRSEGVDMVDSDNDILFTDRLVTVLYPDQYVPQNSSPRTILFMKEAHDCRPGFVSLKIGQLGKRGRPALLDAIIQKGDTYFVSSDIYREQCSNLLTKKGIKSFPNGPSNTVNMLTGTDSVICFPCNSWPKVANEWLTRTRLYGWPSEKLINSIGQSGCHIVPVGDKCSSHDTLLQWRVSFVAAERRLVHSLSHIQFKVYVLLKYFLKQIKGTLKDTVGDDDILCSYFMKILIFVAVENTSQRFWQERNFFLCFWFCFNILIDWVLEGYCPNYFIPAHNMFQRKVHGQHQRKLLEILNNCHRMKWMCFPHLLKSLSNPRTQAELQHPRDSQDIDCGVDITVINALRRAGPINRNVLKTMAKTLHLLSKSQTESEEIITYTYAMNTLSEIARIRADQGSMVDGQGNKSRYKTLRKCKHWLIPTASFGTNVLYLATFHFLMGDYKKSLEICIQVMPLASNFKQNVLHKSSEEKARYMLKYTGQGQTLLYRCRKEFKNVLIFFKEEPWMCLPHLHTELSKCNYIITICPLPYAVFLLFMCFHELGDTRGRDAALRQLRVVKYDHEQGGHQSCWVHYLLHICFKTLGDNHRADRAYREAELASASRRWRK
ncbi:uncharacterized protein LOC110449880 [Mizuhopecten yessoensis]|uniref:Cyclic GMP-AMP synthase n=1 Tax=Mizuhopecten yessoensis TaxID=6573 RepID=A0A210QQ88_MIZYE|nr:uncharacterized protein LOC110449880 [Mizuhopecten yessoensis]OWF50902.1 Cyclic GMP-AMP synthase [Mizuhopecten yessoensis]